MTTAVRAFWSRVLIVVGGLLLALCGSCTGFFGLGALVGLARGEDAGLAGLILGAALIVGGIPILIGALLLRWGLRLRQPPRPQAATFD